MVDCYNSLDIVGSFYVWKLQIQFNLIRMWAFIENVIQVTIPRAT